jgi:uncharacterized oxidoreductase
MKMNMTGNTILITGGGSGIGLALAEEFSKLGNQVLVAGRSKDKLKAAEEKGLKTFTADMSDLDSIQDLARHAIKEFPSLNVVIHNAGVMKNENLLGGDNQKTEQETIATNLLGPMRLTDALLPHFTKQSAAVIMTVSSGLAFTPLAMTPTYSATKAAIHSYTQSLRYQLKDTAIQVIELVPPYVQTHLMGDRQANDPHAMPLREFISEVMQILKEQPQANEILVERVHPLRFSADGGRDKYEDFFNQMNDRLSAARKSEL